MKELNLKFDIKKMTDEFNNAEIAFSKLINEEKSEVTNEQMNKMVQMHAFSLGIVWNDGRSVVNKYKRYVQLWEDGTLTHDNKLFKDTRFKVTGLEFFSIKPPHKMVTVKMSEESYNSMTGVPITESWELVE